MRVVERVYKALADWNRLRILKILEVKPMCVCGVAHILEIAQSAVSRHLRVLSDAELITRERDGGYVEYSLNYESDLNPVRIQLNFLKKLMNEDAQIIKDQKMASQIYKCDFPKDY